MPLAATAVNTWVGLFAVFLGLAFAPRLPTNGVRNDSKY
jgi:hypothetical protein